MSDALFAATEASIGMFNVVIGMVNTNINPGNADYKEYYVHDQSIFAFSSLIGNIARIPISEDTIETDNSLLPWTEIET